MFHKEFAETKLKNCSNCEFIFDDGESVDGYTLYNAYRCHKRPNVENLKSFPFKKEQACFQLNFWLSEFADQYIGLCNCDWDKRDENDNYCVCGRVEADDEVLRNYRMKYSNEYMKSN
jgi:hypothetical protein